MRRGCATDSHLSGVSVGILCLRNEYDDGRSAVWVAVLISMTNVTSAGQVAGTDLLLAHGPYLEIAVTTFIINLRYMLMSLSLSQKTDESFTLGKRLLAAFCVTDEIFAVAECENRYL